MISPAHHLSAKSWNLLKSIIRRFAFGVNQVKYRANLESPKSTAILAQLIIWYGNINFHAAQRRRYSQRSWRWESLR